MVVAHGGPSNGYALSIEGRKPSFHVRANNDLATATANLRLAQGWNHLVGVLGKDKSLKLYVNGKLEAEGKSKAFIATDRKSTRLNSSHIPLSRMPSSA